MGQKRHPKQKEIILVAGTRPNFMKIAPLLEEMKKYPELFRPFFVHTGQHYDDEMSRVFLRELGLPEPDVYLGVGSASHAVQTAQIMMTFEKVVEEEKPDLVVVVGDVNSTLACALVASKGCVSVAHVEAGLRSFDRTMPEEINRVLTDRVSDFLFTTSIDIGKPVEFGKFTISIFGNIAECSQARHVRRCCRFGRKIEPDSRKLRFVFTDSQRFSLIGLFCQWVDQITIQYQTD